ncbi:MAG: hypothetical protein ACRD7E_24670 [Bryobacteraceae bacterium]
MNQETLLLVMTVFVIVSAVALCIQAGLLFGIYKATKSVQEQAVSVLPQVRSILTKAEATVDESRKHVVEITAKANEMMDLGRTQLVKLDSVLTDASSRARVQLERAELVVDDTVSRVHESVTAVHNGILRPIREINGVAAGVKTAVAYFLRGGRPSVAQATQDDEMFI